MQFLDFFDFLTNSVMMPIAALATCILILKVVGFKRMDAALDQPFQIQTDIIVLVDCTCGCHSHVCQLFQIHHRTVCDMVFFCMFFKECFEILRSHKCISSRSDRTEGKQQKACRNCPIAYKAILPPAFLFFNQPVHFPVKIIGQLNIL